MNIQIIGSKRFDSLIKIWQKGLEMLGHQAEIYNADFCIGNPDCTILFNYCAYIGPDTLKQLNHLQSQFKENRTNPKIVALESWGKGNGIGYNHKESFINHAKELGVFGLGSPIDTFYPYFFSVWNNPPDIFGPAGKERIAAVNYIDRETKKIGPSED